MTPVRRFLPWLIGLAGGCQCLAVSAQVGPSPTLSIYGLIDLGVAYQNQADVGIPILNGTVLSRFPLPAPFAEGLGTGSPLGGNGMETPGWHVTQSAKSRLGIKIVSPISSGLTARAELEHRFYPDNGRTSTDEGAFWDKAIVGLTSREWGDWSLGRDYMPIFYPQYVLDPWLNAGMAQVGGNLYAFSGYLNNKTRFARYNNGIYQRMSFGSLSSVLGMSFKESTGTGLQRQFANRWGLSLMYNHAPWFVGVGYDTSTVLQSGAREQVWLLGASYDAGWIKPRLSHSRSVLKAAGPFAVLGSANGMGNAEIHPSSWTLAATVPAGTGRFFKLGVTRLHWDDAGANRRATKQYKWSLGYEHSLSNRSSLYTDITQGQTGNLPIVRGWNAGLRHKF